MEAKRWDPIVKLTHWGIVAAVIGNALITEEGSGWHIWVGYGLAALLALRLLWGLVGPREARFAAFPPSLARARDHIAEIRGGVVTPHASHNPLGALMTYAIWATLLVVVGTGIAMSGPPPADPASIKGEQEEGKAGEMAEDEEHERADAAPSGRGVGLIPSAQAQSREREGEAEEDEASERREAQGKAKNDAAVAGPGQVAPLADPVKRDARTAGAGGEYRESHEGEEEGEEEEGALGEVHELAVNLLYVLIALHLMGVVFESRRSGPQIVRAMLPGGNRN